jgi:acylphosphatase
MTRNEAQKEHDSTGRVHLYVSGIVQGVFFRAHTSNVACSLGLTGWAKNLSDGRVEIVAEGPRHRIAEFIKWCDKGPPAATVDEVEVNWETALDEFTAFTVIH